MGNSLTACSVLINPNPETRNPKSETRNPKPEKRNSNPETRNPKPETRNPKNVIRNPNPEIQALTGNSLAACPVRGSGFMFQVSGFTF